MTDNIDGDEGVNGSPPYDTPRRLELLERDSRSHARSLSELVNRGKTFSPEQMAQLHSVFREELADVGLRVDPDHIDEARADFRFVRSLRRKVNWLASAIGWVVILAVLGAIGTLFTIGVNTWRGQ
jgi:hypothetical protein